MRLLSLLPLAGLLLVVSACGTVENLKLDPTSTASPTATPTRLSTPTNVPAQPATLSPIPATGPSPALSLTPTSTVSPAATPTPPPAQALAEPSSTPYLSPTPVPPKREDPTYARRTPFVPLDDPILLQASEATYLPDEDLVLGLEMMGEARAYPVRMMTYHHIVNDTVGGRPVLITY